MARSISPFNKLAADAGLSKVTVNAVAGILAAVVVAFVTHLLTGVQQQNHTIGFPSANR